MAEIYDFYKHHMRTSNMNNTHKINSQQNEHSISLKSLKDKIWSSTNVILKEKSFCDDDNFLNRFLYAKKNQTDEAFNLLLRYFSFKNENLSILKDINIFDEKIQLAIRDGNPRVLKQRDRKGRKIVTFTAANWDPNKYSLVDIFRAFLISIDILLENVQNQTLGFVIIVDWTNFNSSQYVHIKPNILKLMIHALQDCIPAKFKGVHFISQPWFVGLTTSLITTLLSNKSKKRLIVHGANLAALHNFINKDILPPDLGGEGPHTSTLDWYHFLIETSQSSTSKSYKLIDMKKYSSIPQTKRNIETLFNK